MSLPSLTILQPWAHLIVRGPKRIENRTWAPPRSLVGGYLAIHAGKRIDVDAWDGATETAAFDQFRDAITSGFDAALDRDAETGNGRGRKHRRAFVASAVPYGAIIAVCRVTGYVRESASRWFCGPIGWVLDDVTPIEPVPCLGAQQLWTVSEDVTVIVRERWKAARGKRGA